MHLIEYRRHDFHQPKNIVSGSLLSSPHCTFCGHWHSYRSPRNPEPGWILYPWYFPEADLHKVWVKHPWCHYRSDLQVRECHVTKLAKEGRGHSRLHLDSSERETPQRTTLPSFNSCWDEFFFLFSGPLTAGRTQDDKVPNLRSSNCLSLGGTNPRQRWSMEKKSANLVAAENTNPL